MMPTPLHANLRWPTHRLAYLASTPFIYGMIVPLLMLDLCAEIYQRVCFPLYGLPCIKREEYIRVADRLKLTYLSPIERINCAYCGYGNGVLHYVSAIAAATEQHFCNIRHEDHEKFHPPTHHRTFLPYGDATAYHAVMQRPTSSQASLTLENE